MVIFISLFFVRFFQAARIGSTFGCLYPTNLNSLGQWICVHQGKISAAAGHEPGTTLPMSYPGTTEAFHAIKYGQSGKDNDIFTNHYYLVCVHSVYERFTVHSNKHN